MDSPNKLAEELKKHHIDAVYIPHEGGRGPRPARFEYRKMVSIFVRKADKYGRDLQDDLMRLIAMYHMHGNNIDRIVTESLTENDSLRESVAQMKAIYGIKSSRNSSELDPTLSRITEAFPQYSLILTEMMDDSRLSQLRIMTVSSDLGVGVHRHFMMTYFPALIQPRGYKAQAGLLLFNLCHAMAIVRTKREEQRSPAFASSCRYSHKMMEQRLAPPEVKEMFTTVIESYNFEADMLCKVWKKVIGDELVMVTSTTNISEFHNNVLNAQPLDLPKWRRLFEEAAGNER